MTKTLSEKLKEHRKDKGYSLGQLSRLSGVSKSYLWELENRPERKPSGNTLAQLAKALEVTADYLLDEKALPDDKMTDTIFLRKFNSLKASDQTKILEIMDLWGSNN